MTLSLQETALTVSSAVNAGDSKVIEMRRNDQASSVYPEVRSGMRQTVLSPFKFEGSKPEPYVAFPMGDDFRECSLTPPLEMVSRY